MVGVSQAVLSQIALVALDVDGVMTGGEIIFLPDGSDMKIFNAKDGLGIRRLVKHGIHVAIISGRKSFAVTRRAEELGIVHVHQGVRDKVEIAKGILAELDLSFEAMAYMGDDLPDIPLLSTVGFSACPSDAVAEVQGACQWISPCPGGRGAVRSLSDMILTAKGI